MSDNTLLNRGIGNWQFCLYKPEDTIIGPFNGNLIITKDFYSVLKDDMCVINIPSPNIAYALNVATKS